MFKGKTKTIILPAVIAILMLSLLFVPMAFAAQINITQKAADGGTNPASTIIIADKDGNTVKEIPYAGGDAKIDPVTLDAGYYTITAKADGYLFNKKGGDLGDSGATIDLLAYNPVNINLTISVSGVTDYTGIGVKLFKGSDTSGEPKATATSTSSGKIAFENQIPGDYTLVFDVPSTMTSVSLPNQTISIPVSTKGDFEVTAPQGGSTPESTYAISIKAVDSNGKAVSQASFSVYKGEGVSGTSVGQGTTSSSGAVTIKLTEAGTYTIRATGIPNGYTEPATQTIEVKDSSASATFTFAASTISKSTTSDTNVSQTADPQLMLIGAGIIAAGIVGAFIFARKNHKKR